jgi:hypothetical protein
MEGDKRGFSDRVGWEMISSSHVESSGGGG